MPSTTLWFFVSQKFSRCNVNSHTLILAWKNAKVLHSLWSPFLGFSPWVVTSLVKGKLWVTVGVE